MGRKLRLRIAIFTVLAYLVAVYWGMRITDDSLVESAFQSLALLPFLAIGLLLLGYVGIFLFEFAFGIFVWGGEIVVLTLMGRQAMLAWDDKMAAIHSGMANWIRTVGSQNETNK